MLESLADLLDVSTTVVQALLALVLFQLAVPIWALVDLARRRRVRFDKKWIWALIIIFLGNSFIGPIVYAAVGRNVPQESAAETGSPASDNERTRRAVDALYGEAGRGDDR